ncbi:mitochondrial amidoxime reducing component 2-like [Periplaneta americana]|uniref:mitochondrial amidoxime reducing component 2-like n=1 Tax=Periplaneta americana TaxID=6978 RepID=UPI0037E86944
MSPQFLHFSQTSIALGATAIAATIAAVWWHRVQRKKIPTKWRRVGEISELIFYPLKSGRGFELEEAECTELGLRTTDNAPKEIQNLRDRTFLVYDANTYAFMTCRKFPSLMLVSLKHAGDGIIVLEAPGMPALQLKLPDEASVPEKKTLTMWFDEKVEAVDCGDEAAAWLCQYLKKEGTWLRLGYHAAERVARRRLTVAPWDKFKKYYSNMQDEYSGAFADLVSFMLISESSLEDLKKRLPTHLQTIPPKQFRPNLVVKGTKPYEEDDWDWVKIGEHIVMRGVKPCTRCTMTTMDPETGIREPSMEPLRTLKAYRQLKDPRAKELEGDSPVMGLYLGLHAGGLAKVGDPVYVG